MRGRSQRVRLLAALDGPVLRRRGRLLAALLAMVIALPTSGTPYWVEYDPAGGNFPEAEGWTRYTSGGGAARWIENGALVIDSQASPAITDCYAWWRPGELDPNGPTELFVAQWALRIDTLQGPWDPTFAVYSDERRSVHFDFSEDGVSIPGEGTVAIFQPGVFHEFELRSTGMATFDLYVDGFPAYSGAFTVPLLSASLVVWGDNTIGGASLAPWQYVRFGVTVVPEPCAVCMLLTALLVRLTPRG